MSSELIFALASVLVVSCISLFGILVLGFKTNVLEKMLLLLVSLAAGALFGDALIHLLPEAVELSEEPGFVGVYALLGVFLFFGLEKFLKWRHKHGQETEDIRLGADPQHKHIAPVGRLVILSDGVHNFIDGLIIGASYMVSIEVGIATTIAVILHEIPQEIGDFGVLLHAGYRKMRALMLNFVSALMAFFGLAVSFALGSLSEGMEVFLTAFAAGAFLYIAGSDLVPILQKTEKAGASIRQFAAMIVGSGLMYLLIFLE